jgi:hypothetical protein
MCGTELNGGQFSETFSIQHSSKESENDSPIKISSLENSFGLRISPPLPHVALQLSGIEEMISCLTTPPRIFIPNPYLDLILIPEMVEGGMVVLAPDGFTSPFGSAYEQ